MQIFCVYSLENKHLTGLLPENTDFYGRVEGSYMKFKTSLPGGPALKGGTLQSLPPGIFGPSSPAKLEKN